MNWLNNLSKIKLPSMQWAYSLIALTVSLSAIAVAQTIDVRYAVPPIDEATQQPVAVDDLGWKPEEVPEALAANADLPAFMIVGNDRDHSKDNVRLWTFTQEILGKHTPNYRQQTGDCVSFGWKNAIEYMLATVLSRERRGDEWRPVFPPYMYGVSRCEPDLGNKRLRGAGSTGGWAAKGSLKYGVYPADEPGTPNYSGSLADEWGRTGTPQKFKDYAKDYLVKTVSLVTNPEDAMNALCNGYPVTIASDAGFQTIRPRDGRMVGTRNGRWMHQMCVIGYDGSSPSGERYFYVLNSWGETAHPAPLQGEPPGGFWITWNDMAYILRQNDSYAYSGFDGFYVQELDWTPKAFMESQMDDDRLEQAVTAFTWHERIVAVVFWFGIMGSLVSMASVMYFGPFGGRFVLAIVVVVILIYNKPAAAQEFVAPAPDVIFQAEPEKELIFLAPPEVKVIEKIIEVPVTKEVRIEVPVEKEVIKTVFAHPEHTVYVYVTDWCQACPKMKDRVGSGSEKVAVKFMDESLAPVNIGTLKAFPTIYYPEFGQYTEGVKTIEEIERQLKFFEEQRAAKRQSPPPPSQPPSKPTTPSKPAVPKSVKAGSLRTQVP